MNSIPLGSLLRVKWIENPNVDAEWGDHLLWFEDELQDANNTDANNDIVMLLEWMPFILNSQNIITFKCLWEDNIYYSSTAAINSIVKHGNQV